MVVIVVLDFPDNYKPVGTLVHGRRKLAGSPDPGGDEDLGQFLSRIPPSSAFTCGSIMLQSRVDEVVIARNWVNGEPLPIVHQLLHRALRNAAWRDVLGFIHINGFEVA